MPVHVVEVVSGLKPNCGLYIFHFLRCPRRLSEGRDGFAFVTYSPPFHLVVGGVALVDFNMRQPFHLVVGVPG
jgi:hypothetical protein